MSPAKRAETIRAFPWLAPRWQTYEIIYFTHSPTLPGQNPWWGPYCEFIEATCQAHAKRIAREMFGDGHHHIEYVRVDETAK